MLCILHAGVARENTNHVKTVTALASGRRQGSPVERTLSAHVSLPTFSGKASEVAQMNFLNPQLEPCCAPKGQIVVDD
ncbi:hypothetical protein [Cupriavidus sp. D39]|uniref:hypothetical protein n=1 Tax=Cupriavidus sp. D39 TaxID=2997877 RepID=UPI00226F2FC4|nr:hypothetical protein [Cupriavidus sp. D39]MCY0854375.1 hypothetical protein [Cupriavidus sp. D39]